MVSRPDLQIHQRGDVIEMRLDRATRRNALTRSMLAGILAELRTIPRSTRLLVLSANGPAFCAGMDLGEMEAAADQPNAREIWLQDAELYRNVVEALLFLPCPTVCLVQGPVMAGGVGLVLACDIVIGTDQASFGLPEPKRGITASIVLPLLKHRIAVGPAGYLLLSGNLISAETANRFGLIHELVSENELEHARDKFEASIQFSAPLALQATKRQLMADHAGPLVQALDAAMKLSADARALPEAREGLQAFRDHRPANWTE